MFKALRRSSAAASGCTCRSDPSRLSRFSRLSHQHPSTTSHNAVTHLTDIPWHTMTYHDIPWHTMTYHDIPWHTMTYHDIPWHTMTWWHHDMVIFSNNPMLGKTLCDSQISSLKSHKLAFLLRDLISCEKCSALVVSAISIPLPKTQGSIRCSYPICQLSAKKNESSRSPGLKLLPIQYSTCFYREKCTSVSQDIPGMKKISKKHRNWWVSNPQTSSPGSHVSAPAKRWSLLEA